MRLKTLFAFLLCLGAQAQTVTPPAYGSGGGGGGVSGSGTIAYISCWTGTTSLGICSLQDNGTIVSIAEPVAIGANAPASTWFTGSGGLIGFVEGTCTGTAPSGSDWICADAAGHALYVAYNGGAFTALGSGGSGITQLTGNVTAGPGSGSQVATIPLASGITGVNVGGWSSGGTWGSFPASEFIQQQSGSADNLSVTAFNPGEVAETIQGNSDGTDALDVSSVGLLFNGNSGAFTISATGAVTESGCASGTYVAADGSGCSTPGGGGSPGGSDTDLQFNQAGAFGGSPAFTVDYTNGLMTLSPSGTGTALTVNGDSAGDDGLDVSTFGNKNNSAVQVIVDDISQTGAVGITSVVIEEAPGAGNSIYSFVARNAASGSTVTNQVDYYAPRPGLGTVTGTAAAFYADSGWPNFLYDADTSAANLLAGNTTLGTPASGVTLTVTAATDGANAISSSTTASAVAEPNIAASATAPFGATGIQGQAISNDTADDGDLTVGVQGFATLGGSNQSSDFAIGVQGEVTFSGGGTPEYMAAFESQIFNGGELGNLYAYHAQGPEVGTVDGVTAAFLAESGWPYALYDADASAQVLIGNFSGGGSQFVTADDTGLLGVLPVGYTGSGTCVITAITDGIITGASCT